MRTLCWTHWVPVHVIPGARPQKDTSLGGKFTFTLAQVDRGVATTPTSPVTSSHTVPSDIILTESSSAALNYSRLEN